MYIVLSYVCLFVITLLSISLIYMLAGWLSVKRRMLLFDHYEEILLILEQSKAIAYKKVWQEEVAIEGVSGFKVASTKLKIIQSKYVKLVSEFCGVSIMNDLEEIHGNLDSLILFLITGFITKLNEDEQLLRQHIVEGAMDDEDGEGKMFIDKLIGPGMPSSPVGS